MFDREIRAIGLFFFLAILDDRKALQASTKAVDLFFLKMKKSPQISPAVALVSVTKKIWDKSHANQQRGRPHYSKDSGWLIPDTLDLSPWKEFQQSAPEDEFLITIWSQVLKISDQELSSALGLTEGTIRYRVGRALRKLGGMDHSKGRQLEMVRT